MTKSSSRTLLRSSLRAHAAEGKALTSLRDVIALGGSPKASRKASAPSKKAIFLAALRKFSSRHPAGTLLLVSDLRPLVSLSAPQFDSVALSLFRAGDVILHH